MVDVMRSVAAACDIDERTLRRSRGWNVAGLRTAAA